MAENPEVFFDGIRKQIHEALHQPREPAKRFITKSSQVQIWKPKLVEVGRILKLNFDQSVLVEKTLLCTLGILVQIRWREWGKFKDIFIHHQDGKGQRERTDEAICHYTYEGLISPGFLGEPDLAQSFLDYRYCFLPLYIEKGEVIIKKEEGWRLPFENEERKVIGEGSYGAVTKEIIAVRQYRDKDAMFPNDKPLEVACKTFAVELKYAFEKEILNLQTLHGASTTHRGIVNFLAVIKIGTKNPEFSILSPLATMNLRELLYHKNHKKPQPTINLQNMLDEARNLVDALDYLHNDLRLREGHVSCCHMDLKPENILVYMEEPSKNPVGIWKISDFGISSIQENAPDSRRQTGKQSNLLVPSIGNLVMTKTAQVYPELRTGTWLAPELHQSTGKVYGKRNDVWSYGCVFVQVLARSIGGVEKLEELDAQRGLPDPGEKGGNDTFYRGTLGNFRINPAIKIWLDALSTKQTGHDQKILENCRKLILRMLEIDPDVRIKAKQIGLILKGIGTDEVSHSLSTQLTAPRIHQNRIQSSTGPGASKHSESGSLRPTPSLHLPNDHSGSTIDIQITDDSKNSETTGYLDEDTVDSLKRNLLLIETAIGKPSRRQTKSKAPTQGYLPGSAYSQPRRAISSSLIPPQQSRRSHTVPPNQHAQLDLYEHQHSISSPVTPSPDLTLSIPNYSGSATFISPETQTRRSEGSQEHPGRPSFGSESRQSQSMTSSISQIQSTIFAREVPKQVKHTIISSRCQKVAFVTHECVVLYVITKLKIRLDIPAPEGIIWISASLSERFLLVRGQDKVDNQTVYYLYRLHKVVGNSLPYERVEESPWNGSKIPYLDGVICPNDRIILLQNSTAVQFFSIQEPPIKSGVLEVEGQTKKCWFDSTGKRVFTWSEKGQDHYINMWHIDDIQNHHRFKYHVPEVQNFETPVRGVFSFPDASKCIIWKQDEHVSILSDPSIDSTHKTNWHMPGLRALVVSPDGDSIISIRKRTYHYFRQSYEIFRSVIEYKDQEERFSIRDAGAGIKLKIPLEDDKAYTIAVDSSIPFQTSVMIGHCDGQLEEITLL